jgi:iduronate 2-sulfatase
MVLFVAVVSVSFSQSKPNVLFIICDDLNYVVQAHPKRISMPTPGIDRLRRKGVEFTNAQANSPICAPSRASFLSGLYPQTTKLDWFDDWRQNPILKSSVSFLNHFLNNGYNVYGTGKINHGGVEDYSAYTAFGPKANLGPFPWDGDTAKKKQMLEHPGMKYIFDSVNTPFRWEATFGPLSNIPEWKDDTVTGVPGFRGWMLDGAHFKYINDNERDLMPDELSAEWAISIINQQHEKPFFLGVGFNRPHTPLYAPQKYFDQFPLDKIQFPPHLKDDTADVARTHAPSYLYGFRRFKQLQTAGGDDLWKKWIQAYLANVAFVDDQIAKVLDALEQSPSANNTIIILTSDHGYHMGEKSFLFKQTGWEESARIPLIIYAPGITKSAGSSRKPVSLIDIYPTLIDLCELPLHPNANGNGYLLDGYSLQPLLKKPNGKWDGPSVALTVIPGKDYMMDPTHLKKENVPPHFSIRSKHWRYILTGGNEEELYNHRNDPLEWHNIAADPAYFSQKKDMKRQLLKLLQHQSIIKSQTMTGSNKLN